MSNFLFYFNNVSEKPHCLWDDPKYSRPRSVRITRTAKDACFHIRNDMSTGMYKPAFRHSGASPEGRRCLWIRPRRNYAKHSFVPSTEATCTLTCKKNTNESQHPQNRRMNTKALIYIPDSIYHPHRISMPSPLNADISFRDSYVIRERSQNPNIRARWKRHCRRL